MNLSITIFLLILLLIVGCLPSAPPATIASPAPTATALSIQATIAGPTAMLVASLVPSRQAPEIEGRAESCQVDSPGSAIRYTIEAELDYNLKRLTASQQVTFRNNTGASLEQLVFHVYPNREPRIFNLESVTLEGSAEAPSATLEGARLSIPLAEPLAPGCHVTLNLQYELSIPHMGAGFFPRQGYLGYSDQQLNLALWFPMLAHYTGGEWITPILINVGEQSVLPAADFDVTLTVSNAPDIVITGPGIFSRDSRRWHFRLDSARDLAITMSTGYRQHVAEALGGAVQVELYTFDRAETAEAAEQALHTAVAALDLFADLYGVYPYDRLVVVESDFPDGMEFSGLVYVGSEWFRSYQGIPASYLTLITAHEVAHQWWYHLVANDQSRHPWLDEALATYSEYVFLQERYPELADWWWDFRVNSYTPEGFVDSTVYEFSNTRSYINAVYLRGAQFLHTLRQDIGTEAFFAWLSNYVARMQGQIATPDDLWAALEPELLNQTRATRQTFLRDSGPAA